MAWSFRRVIYALVPISKDREEVDTAMCLSSQLTHRKHSFRVRLVGCFPELLDVRNLLWWDNFPVTLLALSIAVKVR
jgi:hypothetical protein